MVISSEQRKGQRQLQGNNNSCSNINDVDDSSSCTLVAAQVTLRRSVTATRSSTMTESKAAVLVAANSSNNSCKRRGFEQAQTMTVGDKAGCDRAALAAVHLGGRSQFMSKEEEGNRE